MRMCRKATGASAAPRAALVALVLACAALPARGETVTLSDGLLSFDVPPEFRAMTAEEKQRARRGFPQEVGFTATESLSVFVTATRADFAGADPTPLEDYVEVFSGGLEGFLPGLEWERQGWETVNGSDWIHVAFTAAWEGQEDYWVVLLHPWDTGFYTITCIAPAEERAAYEAVFDAIVASARLAP